MMANDGVTALDASTGEERWRIDTGATLVPYAPMVVRDHVYVSGGSGQGKTRAWLESRNVNTGERAWIWYSTPHPGEPAADTWPSVRTMEEGGGSPWQPLTYDPETNLVYFGTGNADPMKDGRSRLGDNLYTSTIVALDADSGELAWHFQVTPHDDHDYDATQVTVLFDAQVNGVNRQLLGLAGRNGFFVVLDRTNGENLLTRAIFDEVNWSEFNRPNGSPQPRLEKSPQPGGALVFPSSEGVTNWPAPSYSPQTSLFYFNAVRSRSIFYLDGEEYFIGSFRNSLHAINPLTGEEAWRHEYPAPYGIHARYPGVLSTAGGLVVTGDVSGNVVAFDAGSGEILWHDELPLYAVSNAPITYMMDGRQYIAVGTGRQIVAYALP
jgi:alcohol dehydrogenase (cytochrome c)